MQYFDVPVSYLPEQLCLGGKNEIKSDGAFRDSRAISVTTSKFIGHPQCNDTIVLFFGTPIIFL